MVPSTWGKNGVEIVIRVSVLQNVKSSTDGWWWCLCNSMNILNAMELYVVVVKLLSHVWLFVTPWTAAKPLVLHYLSEFAQTLICWVCDAIQPFHPLSSPSPPALNLSQHQGLFQWDGSLHQVAKDWRVSFTISPSNEYSELISFRISWLDLLAVQGTLKSLL